MCLCAYPVSPFIAEQGALVNDNDTFHRGSILVAGQGTQFVMSPTWSSANEKDWFIKD